MMALLPVQLYGLEVPAGGDVIPASDFPATLRITMAAIDPTAPRQQHEGYPDDAPARATLKIIRERDFDDDEEEDDDRLRALMAELGEDEDDSEDDEEVNGGPSDPARSKKALKDALKKAQEEDEDEDMDMDSPKVNGAKAKGKGKATDDESDSDEEEDNEDLDDEDDEIEEFVLCTLDTEKTYQQPIDITIGEDERVYFKVTGTHNVHISGNYVVPQGEHEHGDDDDDEDYDLSPDEDELYDESEESDELDDLADPRVTEVESEEDAPKLVKAEKGDKKAKGKNKRAADEEDEPNLDDLINKSLKPEPATNGESKKANKKQKTNEGKAVDVKAETPAKVDKKSVSFAKNLEQGPTPSPKNAAKTETKVDAKAETKKDEKPKASLGIKTVNGVKIDDKKLGTGPAAKNGNKVSMRYIGKLEKDGKVFDSNKKGKPFTFTLGKGEVIKGWDIGIAGISVGGERRITVPGHLAYGSKGVPGIPPNATLIFDVKCLEIK